MVWENTDGYVDSEFNSKSSAREDDVEYEIDGAEEHDGDSFDPEKINVKIAQPTIYNIVQRIIADPQEIDMCTKFQRGHNIWNDVIKSRLIESLLLRIPLPAFYFDGTDDEKWLVVDGLQRLWAFYDFMGTQTLKLKGLEYLKQYEGKTFAQLPRNMVRRIEETQIIANVIQPGTPDEVKFNIFKRINTSGYNLNSQEIRHAVYHGQAADFIEELSEFPEFKMFKIPEKRMDDQEVVTRFIAFFTLNEKQYKPTMDDFLAICMEQLKKSTERDRDVLRKAFSSAMNRAQILFKDMAFRKLGKQANGRLYPINKALFEVWSVVLAQLTEKEFSCLQDNFLDFNKKYKILCKDEEFLKSISTGTGHTDAVLCRFGMIRQLVEEFAEDVKNNTVG
jgi:hypothetical protein